MSTHNGKIGRLPDAVREQLNRRLEEGEAGGALVDWLNGLPAVQKVLAAQFGGAPVNEQNLSNWRTGGFQRWQQREERRAALREMAEDVQALADGAEDHDGEMLRHFSAVLAADFAVAARKLLDTVGDPAERCALLQGFLQTLNAMRREENRAERLRLERECMEYEGERDQEEREIKAERERKIERMFGMSPLAAQPPAREEHGENSQPQNPNSKEHSSSKTVPLSDKTAAAQAKANQGKSR